MSLAEVLLVIGTFGLCTGVWTILVVMLLRQSEPTLLKAPLGESEPMSEESTID